MQRAEIERASVDDARKHGGHFQSVTRRWMALLSVIFIICLPKIAVFLDPSVQVHLMYLSKSKRVGGYLVVPKRLQHLKV